MLLALGLLASALGFAAFGALIISAIFSDRGDSADSVYITIGGFSFIIAALFAAAALSAVKGLSSLHGTGPVICAVALAASVGPYSSLVGPPGYFANFLLLTLGLSLVVAYLRRRARQASG